MMKLRSVLISLGLLQVALATAAVAACSGPWERIIFEAEVLTCEPARPSVEEAIAKECSDALASELGISPSEYFWPDIVPRRWTVAAWYKGEGVVKTVEHQADHMRLKASGAVVVALRHSRYEMYPRDGRPAGNWQPSQGLVLEKMLELKNADCSKLVGQTLVFDNAAECCDVDPTSDLSCYLNLQRVRLAELLPPAPPAAAER